MKDYIKSNLTLKLFLLIISALTFITVAICTLFYFTLPNYLKELQQSYLKENIDILIINIDENNDISYVKKILKNFSIQNNIDIELYKEDILIEEYKTISILQFKKPQVQNKNIDINTLDTERILSSKEYIEVENENYEIWFYGDIVKSVNMIIEVFNKIIPLILVFIISISIIMSWILSKYITNPIKKLRSITKQISELNFDIVCESNRYDEFGALTKDIDFLAKRLNSTINELNREIEHEKELEKSRRLFFSAASHELKTPLTVIRNKLEGMIYGYGEYKNYKKYLPSTLNTVRQMERIIYEILIASQINEIVLNRVKVNLLEIINNVIEEYEEIIDLKKIKLYKKLESTYIYADKELIKKVIQNLINNAITYSEDNSQIKIILDNKIITVENTANIISKSEVDKLCEPFYRVDKSRNRGSGGTGLGLYFAKNIIEKHDFDFEIISEENRFIFKMYFK